MKRKILFMIAMTLCLLSFVSCKDGVAVKAKEIKSYEQIRSELLLNDAVDEFDKYRNDLKPVANAEAGQASIEAMEVALKDSTGVEWKGYPDFNSRSECLAIVFSARVDGFTVGLDVARKQVSITHGEDAVASTNYNITDRATEEDFASLAYGEGGMNIRATTFDLAFAKASIDAIIS